MPIRLALWLRFLLIVLSTSTAASMLTPSEARAKEFEIDGTVDCERPNGRHCSVDGRLALLTDDVSGETEHVSIDVSWVTDRLGGLDQDDFLCLTVEDQPGVGLRAIGVPEFCNDTGTANAGLSTGSHEARQQDRRHQGDNDEDDDAAATGPIAAAPPVGGPISRTLTVLVAANVGGSGVDTGVDIAAGQQVTITAAGTGTYGNEGQAGCVGVPATDPNGNRSIGGVPCTPPTKVAPSFPLPTASVGTLIGRIGTSGSFFPVGSSFTSASLNGRLFLRYNDDNAPDNTGGYTVQITITG